MVRHHNIWIVVEAKRGAESTARREAIQQGFEVYSPLYRECRRGGVRRVLHLLSPYIFVKVRRAQRWQSLHGTRGVRSVLMNGEKPSRVLHEDIELFRSMENELGYVVLQDEEPPVLRHGQHVVPTSGCWIGQTGIYHGPTSRVRSRVVFEMMGRALQAEILTRDLASAA